MKARGLLMVEHRLIEKMLLLAKTRIEQMGEANFDPVFVDQIVDFIKVYADRTHHGKEEGILFKKLGEKALDKKNAEVLAELMGEHDQARALVREIVALNEQFKCGDKSGVGRITEIIQHLNVFYPAHIKKEDSEFFPNADAYFSEEELKANLEEYVAFDARMIHEKYLSLYETLANKRLADWNPLEASILKDQSQAYDKMRERCPVAHSVFLGWSLFRHQDIAEVLADPQTYSNASPFPAIPNGMDPPVHGHYRKALDPNFEQKQMNSVEPLVRKIAADLVESMPSSGKVEFIEAFVAPFALKSLCAWLGWPSEQWSGLEAWVQDGQHAAFHKDAVAGKALALSFSELVKSNLAAHKASPGHAADATDALLATAVGGMRLDDDQIVTLLRNWAAGHGTVAGGLGVLVRHLAEHIELQDQLRSTPSLIPAAIEEILRADGPLVANPRTTTREVTIGGRTIPKGEHLTLMWMAANRDANAFQNPQSINLERNNDTSMVWGHGIHLCQGAPLARLEMRVALEELLSRTRHFELGENAAQREVYPSNGLATLPLRMK